MTRFALRLAATLLFAVAAACGKDAGGESADPGTAAGTQDPAARPPFELADAPNDPCQWLPADEVQAILGSFRAPPVRVRPGQNPSPDPYGTGCLYTLGLQPQMGSGTVTLSVELHGGGVADLVSAASASLFGVKPDTGTANSSASGNSGWDHQTRLGTTYLARIGHIGVQVDRGTFEIPDDDARRLAAAVRDKMADRPFANPVDPRLDSLRKIAGSPPQRPPQGPDPCALLTRAEAEAVLGPLTVPPYRSAGDSPLWDANGDSCSYFTNGHRALTITPTWSQGQMTFKMAAGVGAVAANVTGVDGGLAADTLEGPWDDVMQDMLGMLRFLKGDRMLEVTWVTSNTDRAGALRLAATALGRL